MGSKSEKQFIPEATYLLSQGQQFLKGSRSPGVSKKPATTLGMKIQLFISSMYILV